ncbi:pyridoxine kinase [Inquilinus ginsengisoli]|uniref:Pyridoxal kinase PdxY n=1 Tax=Inquilinus ginsengisoli TaxID=363840 RepID=A0ABU1JJM1_9PROT|nr:pyridoxal kinase PdxY [Inquilinus ginsengisoli]MDR6288811.1 pyridoxine kinase [Inquilinus ginsengisoli]
MTAILSIQSSVAYGHVGNSAAVFPLQRLGIDVWPVLTVHFSNHTGYGSFRGPVLPADQIAEVLRGVEERGVLPGCDAVLSGYMGDVSLGHVVLDAVAKVKTANPRAVYCCDPVLGDVGRGFFVRPGLPEFMRDQAVPRADIVTPNQFELEFLAGGPIATLDDALAAARAVQATGPKIVLVTSLTRSDAPADAIEMLAVAPDGAWIVATPRLPLDVNGSGDITAALFLAHWLRSGSPATALGRTAATVFAVMEETHRAGKREIQIVAAQDAIANPPERFAVRQVAG